MRKWQNLAAPDDPGSWYDLDGFWPTDRGTYEVVDINASADYTATSAAAVSYAFYGAVPNPNTVNAEYVIDANRIWRYNAASFGTEMSDKTGGVTIGFRQAMAQYGSVTICVMGSPRGALAGNATVFADLGSNFASLAGAPQGDCISVHSNAVIIANTDTANDGWEASDVGDYTNWSTGEWASGRIFFPSGPITASVSFGSHNYLFKSTSIHRMTYVGGIVKWQVEKVWDGIGCRTTNAAAAGASGILFHGGMANTDTGSPTNGFFWYDGSSPPVQVNPLTEIGTTGTVGPIIYNRFRDVFAVWDLSVTPRPVYFFNPKTMSWGKSTISFGTTPGAIVPVSGVDSRSTSPIGNAWVNSASNTLKFFNPGANRAGAAYIQTSKVGTEDFKTEFKRLTPMLRRRVDLGTDSASLEMTLFREREDTTAQTTRTISEATNRKRFDLLGGAATDNYARFKVTYTDLDVEVDDFKVVTKPAGTD